MYQVSLDQESLDVVNQARDCNDPDIACHFDVNEKRDSASGSVVDFSVIDFNSEHESSSAIEKRLGLFIRRYLSEPTKSNARSVVSQLEKLLRHPDCVGFFSNRCAYRKMLLQWRAACL